MTVWGKRAMGLAAALCATTCLTDIARAQSYPSAPTPPTHQTIDSNGVDLVNAIWNVTGGAVSIGPASGGLSYGYLGAGTSASNVFGAISASGSSYAVSIGGHTELFTQSNSNTNTFIPAQGQASTLVGLGNNNFTYNAADGTVAQFTRASSLAPFVATTAAISTLTRPSGEVLTYTYLPGTMFCGGRGEGGCEENVAALRPQSIASNRGYQLHFSYASDSTNSAAYVQLTQVTAINTAVDYCDPAADTCSNLSQTYPTINYTNGGQTVTDAATRTTSLVPSGSGQTLTKPSGATVTQTPTGTTSFTISNGIGIWSYSWTTGNQSVTTVTQGPATGALTTATTSVPVRTMTVTDPNLNTRIVVSNQTTDQVLSDTDGANNTTTYEYDAAGRLYQVTYPEGNYTQYQYDAGVANGRGNVTQVTQAPKKNLGQTSIITYAAYDATCTSPVKCNKPNSTTDGLGNVTTYTYSTVHGGLLEVVQPAAPANAAGVIINPTTAYTYSQATSYTKNSAGNLVAASIWVPTSSASCATSTPSVTLTATSASLSCSGGASDEVVSSVSYSGVNALPTGTSAGAGDGSLTVTTQTTYNALGDPVTVQGPLGASQTVTYVYDAIRRTIGVIGPNPGVTGLLPRAIRTTYGNLDGYPTAIDRGTVTSASSWSSFSALATESIGYDSIDRKTTDSLVVGGSTQSLVQYSYDAANRLTCSAVRMNASAFGSLPTSACTLGAQGSFGPDMISSNTYDADNRVTQVTDGYQTAQSRNASTVTYSANGNLLTAADANGNLTTYGYDGFDRKTTISYPTLGNGSVSSNSNQEIFGYDANSQLTSDTRRDGQVISAVYDHLGRVSSISLPATAYSYDNLGRLISATRNSQTLTLTYDALNHLIGEFGVDGKVSAQYDLAGRLTKLHWPDGYYVTYVDDWADDVSQIEENGATSGAGVLVAYSYNNLGQRTGVSRAGGAGATTSYGYDGAWRLNNLAHTFAVGANNQPSPNNQTIRLPSYSPAGQIFTRTSSNAAYNWTGSTVLTRAYSSNSQNQMTASGSLALSYDGRGNLTTDGANSFGYDAANNVTSYNSSATMTTDALGRLAAVNDLSGGSPTTSSQTFRYFGSALIAEYGSVGTDNKVMHARYVPGPGTDETVVYYPGSSTTTKYWLLTDERGSVIAQADGSGNLVANSINTYDDYGQSATSNTGRFQYTGQIYIPETGLYHYKARDYAPMLGRFVQTDPIGYGDGMNWYAYAHNDPINGADPSGTVNCGGCGDLPITYEPGGGYSYQANGGTYYFPDGGNQLDPSKSSSSVGEGVFVPGDQFNTSQSTAPSYAPTPPPPNPAAKGAQALQQAAQQAQQPQNTQQPILRCKASNSTAAKVADFASNASTVLGTIATGSAIAAGITSETGVGAVVFGSIATGAETLSLISTGVSVGANLIAGRPGNAIAAGAATLAFAGVGASAARAAASAEDQAVGRVVLNAYGTGFSALSSCP